MFKIKMSMVKITALHNVST